jgi:two-component system, response regulator
MGNSFNTSHLIAPVMENGNAADILLVEDDANDAELTISALSGCGLPHEVEHVEDGEDALDYISATGLFASRNAKTLPRVILLDLKLNKVGGLQVLRELKADERTRNVPIVVLTASESAIEVIESYKFGVNSYVIKPPDRKQFLKVLADVGRYWLGVNRPPPR